MTDRISIEPAGRTVSIRTGSSVIAESRNVLLLREEGHEPVHYLPRADVAMEFLDRSDKVTHCPWKGDATYFHVVSPARVIENAAWSYESPKADVAAIAGHLAFHPEKLAVEVGAAMGAAAQSAAPDSAASDAG